MLRDLKIPMPSYNGADDYDAFEAFIGKWDSYARSHGLKGTDAIDVIQHALKGKASIWYNKHVSLQLDGWSTKRVYQELYEYCFPASFREDLREKLMSATQRGRPVKDYAKDLENLGIRYSDIDATTVKRIFWEGVDDYIKLYWLDKGLGQEYKTLVYYAYWVERRKQERRQAHSLEVRRDQLQLALADYFSPLTARRSGIRPSGRRFHIIAAGDPDAVDVMPEYFVVYDEVREAELVFPITSFGPLGVDVGRAVAAHLGVTERDLGRVLRLGGRSPPLVERIYSALTQIGNVWAVVRTIHDLVECGGNETDRWLLQTNGAEIWLRDQLYGSCYELSVADLTSGITLAKALRRPELGDRPGVLGGREATRCTSFATDSFHDWQAPWEPSVADVCRRGEWMEYIAERCARLFSRDAEYRAGEPAAEVTRVGDAVENLHEQGVPILHVERAAEIWNFDSDDSSSDGNTDEHAALMEDISGDYGPPPASDGPPSSSGDGDHAAPPRTRSSFGSLSEISFGQHDDRIDTRTNLGSSEVSSSLYSLGSLLDNAESEGGTSFEGNVILVARPGAHHGETHLARVPAYVDLAGLARGTVPVGTAEYLAGQLGLESDSSE
ncbi:hypothetical protein AURDEDRAFT_163533 [Auricularia subglabra TFB-10046 SS5]|nr:hypothetical protein AURDEDRAFT_163533 [Auricularia subglabra TFB-10046 SS5]